MKITKIRTLWAEPEQFVLERTVRNEYIFLHMLTESYAIFERGQKRVHLPAGICFCYSPGSYQHIEAAPGGLLHDWMHLSPDFSEIIEKYGFVTGKIYTPDNDAFVTDLMRQAELEALSAEARDFSKEIAAIKVEELIARLVRAERKTEFESTPPDVIEAFTAARIRIHMEYSRAWETDSMAELVHLSPSRFFTLYKAIFGVTPKNDLLNVRMEHAKYMLLDGNLSVKEVAAKTGYSNVYHFIRYFKEHTGFTPGKYRTCTELPLKDRNAGMVNKNIAAQQNLSDRPDGSDGENETIKR